MADLITHLSSTDLSAQRPSVASVPEVSCGFSCWRPRFLRRWANPKIFVAIFSLIATMRSAYFVYLIGVMSTLEKRYAFPSKLSALILIADNISGMVMSPVIGYLGSKFHGPSIIGWGTVLVGCSSIVSGLPYLIYGPGTHLLSAEILGQAKSIAANTTKYDLCDGSPEVCTESTRHTFVVGAYALFWLGSFVNGLGNTAFWVVGVPYLDDNVQKKNSPVYFSTTMVVRYSGVALGFVLSAFSLSLYENPLLKVNIPRNDPRWIGAWWIGFFIIGFLILLSSIPMFMFPVTMKSGPKKKDSAKKMSFTDAFATFKRIITNPVLVFDTLGGAMRVIGWAGYYITKTRYIEAQFRQSAAGASFLTGSTSSVLKVIGIFCGGLAISKIQPRPKVLIAYVVFIEMVCNVFILAGIFIGCPTPTFGNLQINDVGRASLLTNCNTNCDCTTSVFQPVCGPDKVTNYFSPCFAGCQSTYTNDSLKGFTQCSCSDGMEDVISSGYCKQDCNALPLYLTVIGLAGIISSTAWAGNFLIALRAVDPKDKAFAMGVIGSCMSIFAYIPYPIIFGFVTDAACLVWEESCGETGNCWLYDIDKFRIYLHGTSFVLVMIGSCFDLGVLVYANRLKNLYDDEDEKPQEMDTKDGMKSDEEETLFDVSRSTTKSGTKSTHFNS